MKDLDAYYRGVFLQSFDVDSVNPTAVAAGEADEVPPSPHRQLLQPFITTKFPSAHFHLLSSSVLLMTMNASPVPALALRR